MTEPDVGPPKPEPFLTSLVDWRGFESFVRDLYAIDPNLRIDRNVIEVGRSGARREIDVKVTHHFDGEVHVTLVECKFWKTPVDRPRIDVLAASIEDLGATGGVMFTTRGFEAGAEAYARHKGIELFIVRDLTDAEWGLPGRVIWFFMHLWGAEVAMTTRRAQWVASAGVPPAPGDVDIRLETSRDGGPNPKHQLHSVIDSSAGPNLLDVVLEARQRVLAILAKDIDVFDDGAPKASRSFVVPVTIDLSKQPHRLLLRRTGAILLDDLELVVTATVTQSRFDTDRGRRLRPCARCRELLDAPPTRRDPQGWWPPSRRTRRRRFSR